MTMILRCILFFLLAPAFSIVSQAAGSGQDNFRIVDADFRTELVVLGNLDGEDCAYDSSGALLQQRKSLDGKAADEDCLSSIDELKTSGVSQPLFSFLVEFVAANRVDDFVDLASPSRRRHILDGDATGGGHRPGTGLPGKSEFPAGWSDDRIMHNISDIATDPTLRSRPGRRGRTITEGTRDGIDIRVIQERNGDIVTGFPTNVPRNPRP